MFTYSPNPLQRPENGQVTTLVRNRLEQTPARCSKGQTPREDGGRNHRNRARRDPAGRFGISVARNEVRASDSAEQWPAGKVFLEQRFRNFQLFVKNVENNGARAREERAAGGRAQKRNVSRSPNRLASSRYNSLNVDKESRHRGEGRAV